MNNTPTETGGVILIVDDLQRNLQVLGGILVSQQFEVMFATNGEAALARVEARRPDLILLDLMMPGMDGMEVCRRLKANPKTIDIPVLFLTAANEADLAARAIGSGAVDFVVKPFNTPELLARVRAHVALKRTRDELRRIILEKNELMSAVAHDLKNPISSLRFSALMLQEQGIKPPDRRAELVESMVESCDAVLAFIQDRLERSARTARLEQVSVHPLDLVEVMNIVLTQNLPAASQKEIDLAVDFPDEERIQVCADHGALCRVLNNLVSNAIKFSPPGRRVELAVTGPHQNNRIRTEVRDQGPGISEDDRNRLFQPYVRLSARPTAGESSTGLGLSIARDLVEKMGGEIGCESSRGEGACFWVTLPKS